MKPVYGVRLVDPIYDHYSNEVLANIAVDLLRVFQGANHKAPHSDRHKKKRLFEPSRLSGRDCVKASPDGVKIDFSWATTQSWAFSNVYNAETVIEEMFRRAKSKGVLFDKDLGIAMELTQEIGEFLDTFCIPPALSADDLIYSAQELSQSLRL